MKIIERLLSRWFTPNRDYDAAKALAAHEEEKHARATKAITDRDADIARLRQTIARMDKEHAEKVAELAKSVKHLSRIEPIRRDMMIRVMVDVSADALRHDQESMSYFVGREVEQQLSRPIIFVPNRCEPPRFDWLGREAKP